MNEVRPEASETGARSSGANLETRLTGLPRPAMPPDMAERIRARLRTEIAPAPRPVSSPGPLPFLAQKYGLTPVQQWAFLAVLLTLVVVVLNRQRLILAALDSCKTPTAAVPSARMGASAIVSRAGVPVSAARPGIFPRRFPPNRP